MSLSSGSILHVSANVRPVRPVRPSRPVAVSGHSIRGPPVRRRSSCTPITPGLPSILPSDTAPRVTHSKHMRDPPLERGLRSAFRACHCSADRLAFRQSRDDHRLGGFEPPPPSSEVWW
jgi:hypothetical protein